MEFVPSETAAASKQLEALLLRPVFAPVTEALGEYGDIAATAFAQALARSLER